MADPNWLTRARRYVDVSEISQLQAYSQALKWWEPIKQMSWCGYIVTSNPVTRPTVHMPILAAAELLTGLKVFLHDHSDMPEQPLAISHTNMETGPDGCLGQAGE